MSRRRQTVGVGTQAKLCGIPGELQSYKTGKGTLSCLYLKTGMPVLQRVMQNDHSGSLQATGTRGGTK